MRRRLCPRGCPGDLRLAFLVGVGILLSTAGATPLRGAPPAAPQPAVLDRASVPAVGKQSALLTINRFGRYSITVKSAQGTSVQLVDRMAGPSATLGEAGARDGRLDALLEQGQYKVVTRSHERGNGDAQLEVQPFAERHPSPPLLVELKPVEETLADFEQLSYWLSIEARRRVVLEAAGRNLSDLRLWKEGSWLVDAAPETHLVQPRAGKPLRVQRLTTELEPGLYLLTAYGGPAQAWAEDDDTHPYYMRFGIPVLGEAGRRRWTVSPFGSDRFLVPSKPDCFRIELPEARPATMQVGAFDPDRPFVNEGQEAEVLKQSVPPIAEVRAAAGNARIVTITAEAGQPYVLQHFERRWDLELEGSGEHWVSSVHSGHAEDSIDATAVVVDGWSGAREPHTVPLATQTIGLTRTTGWARRANLLGTLTLFLEVKAAGAYEVLIGGTEARARIEPFMTFRPARYQAPDFRGTGARWDLDAGFHVLTVEPVKKGIVELVVRPQGLLDFALEPLGLARQIEARPVRGAVRFPRLTLDVRHHYTVYLNRQPEVNAGLIVRSLPLDLREPLFVSQQAAETVTVPFSTSEAGTLRAESEDGTLLELSVDGGPWQTAPTVAAGQHAASVRNNGTRTAYYSLGLEPTRLAAQTPLPPLPDTALATLPEFPLLDASAPRTLDLDRGASATFRVRADAPALYRVESTGLLATSGNLRSRTVTSLARVSQNGTGRNFVVQEYLGTGDYQVSVAAQGLSAGHLGVRLARTDLTQAGFLTNGVPARISLAAGQALAYRFKITKPGEFRVRALGLGRELRCRLEDGDGWPVIRPGLKADIRQHFEPGQYRFIVLPELSSARVITRIDGVARPRRWTGHGPHRLPLARRVDHLWLEPEDDGERAPDAWEFAVPAPIDARIELSSDMRGELLRLAEEGSGTRVAAVEPLQGWTGALERGRYRLEVTSVRRNNRARYQLAVWPQQLVAGLDREVQPPADVEVAVGEDKLVELSSFGSVDVKARLYDAAGRLIAVSDDRPDDWNFDISHALAPGRYRLRVEPSAGARGASTVSMRIPQEVAQEPLSPPLARNVAVGRASHVYPLSLAEGAQLLMILARSQESVGVAVEAVDAGGVRSLGSAVGRNVRLDLPLRIEREGEPERPAAGLRLRLWSVDRRDSSVGLSVVTLAPGEASEAKLAQGLPLTAVRELPSTAAAAVSLDRPGLFRVAGEAADLRFCTTPLVPCLPAVNGLVAAGASRLFVVGDGMATARAQRLSLAAGTDVTVRVDPSATLAADVATARNGPVVVAAYARLGQPGLLVAQRGSSVDRSGGTMAVSTHSALSVGLRARETVARFWNAAPGGEPFDVRLVSLAYAPPKGERAEPGVLDGGLPTRAAREFALPPGAKRMHLALGADVAAVLSKDDHVESVHWAEAEPRSETVITAADRMTLLNLRADEGRFSVEIVPRHQGPAAELTLGAPLELAPTRAGVMRVPVGPRPPAEQAMLHVRGAAGEPLFVSARGSVRRGSDIALDGEAGTLEITHGPGHALAWIDRPGEEAEDLWSADREAKQIDLDLPASIALDGSVRALRIHTTRPELLSIRVDCPVVTLLERAGDGPLVEVHPRGAVLDAYVSTGVTRLGLRAFAGGALSGSAEITATPVTPIGEGLGAEVVLAPGATRLFSFAVEREGPVGIGVRASADVVESVLMTSGGQRLGAGTVQMPTLAPATYLLALRTPVEGPTVTVRPALAGLKPPDTGPPDEVVRRYLAPEGEALTFTARDANEAEAAEQGTPEGEEGVAPDDEEEGLLTDEEEDPDGELEDDPGGAQ